MKTIKSACAPYDMGPGRAAPVLLWRMLERLTEHQLRDLAIGYSVHAPQHFETQLREITERAKSAEIIGQPRSSGPATGE